MGKPLRDRVVLGSDLAPGDMPAPITPEDVAALERGEAINPAQPAPPVVAVAAPLPYQPNPGAPNYNPNPGASGASVGRGAVLGADPAAPARPQPPGWISRTFGSGAFGAGPMTYREPPPASSAPAAPGSVDPAFVAGEGAPPRPNPGGPAGSIVYLGANGGGGAGGGQSAAGGDPLLTLLGGGTSGPAVYVPPHEVPKVSAARQAAEQNAYSGVQSAIEQENTVGLEGEKKAERGLAEAKAGEAKSEAEGWMGVADAAGRAQKGIQQKSETDKLKFEGFQRRLDGFSEALAADRVDPNALWHNMGTGRKITWTIASMFGALAQGLLKLPTNQVADQIAAMVKADVDAQKSNHAIKRGRLDDLQSFYSLALKQTHDENEAEHEAFAMGMEVAKAKAMSLGAAAKTPVALAQGEKLAAELGTKQTLNSERKAEVGVTKVQRGIAENPYVAGATTGGGGAGLTDKDRHTLLMKYLETRLEHGATSAEKRAAEIQGIQTTINEQDRQFANLLKHPALDKLGFGPAAANAAGSVGQRVAPDSALVATQVNGLNQMMLGAVGKQLKDTEGRISPPVLEGLHRLEIKPGDTPEVAREKIRQAKAFVDEAARQGGGSAPEAYQTAPSAFTPAGAREQGGPIEAERTPRAERPKAPTPAEKRADEPAHGGFAEVGEKGDPNRIARADGGPMYQRAGGGPIPGDERAYYGLEHREEGGPLPLSEPPGQQLHVAPEGGAFYTSIAPVSLQGASVSGASPRYAAPAAPAAPAPRAERKMTNEEMLRQADQIIAATQAQKEAALAAGPAVQPAMYRGAPAPWLDAYMAKAAREEGGPVKSSATAEAAKKGADAALRTMTPLQSAEAPQFIGGGARLPAPVLAAQGNAEGAHNAQQYAAAILAAPEHARSRLAAAYDRASSAVRAAYDRAMAPAPIVVATAAPRTAEIITGPPAPVHQLSIQQPLTAPAAVTSGPMVPEGEWVVGEPPAREEGGPVKAPLEDRIADALMRLYPDNMPEGGMNLANAPGGPKPATTVKAKMSTPVRGKREYGGIVAALKATNRRG